MNAKANILPIVQKWLTYAPNVRIGSMDTKTVRTNLKMADVFIVIGMGIEVYL